jgi:alpha-ketoglutarate-dependent taurine dioxygenase
MELVACAGARRAATLGAIVRGVSISGRTPAAAAARQTPLQDAAAQLRTALLRSKVLVFAPECTRSTTDAGTLSEDELVDFFSVFDVPLPQDGRENSRGQRNEIFKVTNIHDISTEEAPTSPFLTDAELEFHSDLSYRLEPGIFSALYALKLPNGRTGSTTIFADTAAA